MWSAVLQDCLINLPFEAAVEASDDGHGEGLLLATVDKLAMFPQRRVLSLISEAFLVLQPSGKPIPRALTIILSTLSNCQAPLTLNLVRY